MEVGVDKFGRVLIPKVLRDQLGWKAGVRLKVQSAGDGLLLQLGESESPLQSREGMLLFCGELEGDSDQVLRDVRERRIQQLSGL